jgi:hypothetical protein
LTDDATRSSDTQGLDPEIAYWLEMADALATRDYVQAAIDGTPGNALGLATSEIGGGYAFALGMDEGWFFSRWVGAGITRPATEADVDAAVDFFAAHRRTSAALMIAPHAQPSELVDWIADRGFSIRDRWPKLWRALDDDPGRPPTDLRFELAGAERDKDFATVVIRAFGDEHLRPMVPPAGRPGWAHYLGFDGESPVAAGAMYVLGDVAWLGFGATLESHRGRGGQSAILHRRLVEAKARGCRLAISETGPDSPGERNSSYGNMIRLGFQVGYHRPHWVRG